MLKNNENLMNVLKKGVDKQLNSNQQEIVEEMDDFDEDIVILDKDNVFDNEDYPEYEVNTSINGEFEDEISNEVEFINTDDLSDYDVDPFGEDEMSVLVENKGLNESSTSEVAGTNEESFDDDDLNDDFDELDWGESDFDERNNDIPEEELELQKMYNISLEEEILSEKIEKIDKNNDMTQTSNNVKKADAEVSVVAEVSTDEKFANCVYNIGMSVEDYLRANPNYREKMYIEHFFKANVIEEALTKGLVFLKKGRFMI